MAISVRGQERSAERSSATVKGRDAAPARKRRVPSGCPLAAIRYVIPLARCASIAPRGMPDGMAAGRQQSGSIWPGKALAAAIFLTLAAAPALAQEAAVGSPVPLTPEGAPAALEAPPPAQLGEIVDAAPTGEEGISGIEIGELEELDPDSGGILDASMGGLGADMWVGTDRARLLRLLPQLPDSYDSPTLHDLARRLLLSTAIAPARAGTDGETSLIGLRIERLAAMGLAGAVAEMMAIAPPPETDGVLLRLHVDNRLLLSDNEGACQSAMAGKEVLDPLYRDQITMFCHAVAGDMEAADFGANLLREGGDLDDPAFFSLADALTAGTRPKVKSLTSPAPLHLAMAAAAKAELPSDVLETSSPLMSRALADSTLISDSVQLAAAERAVMASAIGPASLAERYAAMEFSDKELDSALSIAEGDYSPRNRALLYQATKLSKLPVARGAAIQKAWELAGVDGTYLLSVGVYQPELEALQPGAELAWFAPEAARALFLLDQPERALAWAATAQRYASEPEEKHAAALLWPLTALAEGSATGSGHGRWLSAMAEMNANEAGMKAGFAYTLFEAMGERISDDRWEALLQGAARADVLAPDPAYTRAFRKAASAGRLGETVLLAILLLGGGNLEEGDPALLSEIVIGLRMVGLENEARRLAIEAALAGGL